MKKRVVLTYVEAGQGHIVTIESIAEALERKYGDKVEVIRDWVYRADKDKELMAHEQFLIKNVKYSNKHKGALDLQFAFMKTFTEQGTLQFVYKTVFGSLYKKVRKHFEALKPDMIVSTHFEPAFFGIESCHGRNPNNWLNFVYDPDHCVHGWWDRRCDCLFTNNKMATAEAINIKKFSPKHVKQVNFMARDSIMNFKMTKQECRQKHNLPPDKFTVVLADGAYASANLDSFTKELLKIKKPLTIIPICGRNTKLLHKYQKLNETIPENITFVPLPFLNNVEEIYCAADLFITKAGPNAITDSVFVHTPIMTNYYSGPIEKASNKLFTEIYGCGIYEKDKRKARMLVESFIDNPEQLQAYRDNTFLFRKDINGAEQIADEIMLALETPEAYRNRRKRVAKEAKTKNKNMIASDGKENNVDDGEASGKPDKRVAS